MRESIKFSGIREVALHPEESIALRRRSTDSFGNRGDDEDTFSDGFDCQGLQSNAMVDRGMGAWKTLFAAWLIDFMTSGKHVHDMIRANSANTKQESG